MKARIAVRFLIVAFLEQLCGRLDRLPARWEGRWHLNGQLGCQLGLATMAARLDDRWNTGYWKRVD